MSAEVPERQLLAVNNPEGERQIPPILSHFYEYCDVHDVDLTAPDPENGPIVAHGIHDYIRSIVSKQVAGSQALPEAQRQWHLAIAAPKRVKRHLAYFYRDYGLIESGSGVARQRRHARIQEGIRAAGEWSDIYPEVEYTERLAQLLESAGHSAPAEQARILTAAVGHGLREIHEYRTNVRYTA